MSTITNNDLTQSGCFYPYDSRPTVGIKGVKSWFLSIVGHKMCGISTLPGEYPTLGTVNNINNVN